MNRHAYIIYFSEIILLFILYISCSVIQATLLVGGWRIYETVRSCPSSNHMPIEMGMLGTHHLSSSLSCVIFCRRQSMCGSVVFHERDSLCITLDKDFLLCDLTDGIIETVKASSCANNGELVSESQCLCSNEFGGAFCDADSHRTDDCETCQNGGTCEDLFYDFVCHCVEEYTGQHCESHVCDLVTCQNHGTCVYEPSTSTQTECQCVAGFSGLMCETDNGPVVLSLLTAPQTWDSGSWSDFVSCPTGTYFGGYRIRIELGTGYSNYLGQTDATFLCYRPRDLTSDYVALADPDVTSYGHWQTDVLCPAGYFVVRFRQFYQPDQGSAVDDTGVNNIEVTCRGPGMHGTEISAQTGSGASFPNAIWSAQSAICSAGTAVCQVALRVTPDTLGVVDTQLKCCDY